MPPVKSTPSFGWAQIGQVEIAYQTIGQGPVDLVIVPSYVSHLEQNWAEPSYARFLRSLAEFSRLIILDKRGTGLSSRAVGVPSLEDRIDDVRAVMDAVGSVRAALLGGSEGGMVSMLFAATFPARVSHLVLYGTTAKFLADSQFPFAMPQSLLENLLLESEKTWGTGKMAVKTFAPSRQDDPALIEWAAKFERLSATPGSFRSYLTALSGLDLRPTLSAIQVPTLILHRTEDKAVSVEHARYLASKIPHAKLVEMPGEDHFWFVGDSERIVQEVETFITGRIAAHNSNRILATILFTDIVDSTDRVVEATDPLWADLLAQYGRITREQLSVWDGRFVSDTGDGMLATFTRPSRGVECAFAVRDAANRLGLRIRTGLHCGEIELDGANVRGIHVHIAARVMAGAAANEIVLSRTVRDLIAGSKFQLAEKTLEPLKGIPPEWQLNVVFTVSQKERGAQLLNSATSVRRP